MWKDVRSLQKEHVNHSVAVTHTHTHTHTHTKSSLPLPCTLSPTGLHISESRGSLQHTVLTTMHMYGI